jgi:hypothetical protein
VPFCGCNGALDIAADLSTSERVLLFCLASGTEWAQAGVTGAIRACPPLMDRCRACPYPLRIWCEARSKVPRHLGLKPVSADIRTRLCSQAGIPPGKSLARPETGRAFLATPADSGGQRPHRPASPAAKPRKVKDYSDGAMKPELRRTGWWARQVVGFEPMSGQRSIVSVTNWAPNFRASDAGMGSENIREDGRSDLRSYGYRSHSLSGFQRRLVVYREGTKNAGRERHLPPANTG